MRHLLLALVKADFFLLTRIAMPMAHWIDWRFHRSPYQQAKAVLWLAQGLQIAGVVMSARSALWWIAPMMVLVVIFTHFTVFRDYRRKLDACQRQFERRPDMICFEQYYFMMLLVPPPRLFQLIMGWLIMAPLLAIDIKVGGGWGGLMNSWVWLIAIALYLAGGMPPLRPRREKKALALPGMVPHAT